MNSLLSTSLPTNATTTSLNSKVPPKLIKSWWMTQPRGSSHSAELKLQKHAAVNSKFKVEILPGLKKKPSCSQPLCCLKTHNLLQRRLQLFAELLIHSDRIWTMGESAWIRGNVNHSSVIMAYARVWYGVKPALPIRIATLACFVSPVWSGHGSTSALLTKNEGIFAMMTFSAVQRISAGSKMKNKKKKILEGVWQCTEEN